MLESVFFAIGTQFFGGAFIYSHFDAFIIFQFSTHAVLGVSFLSFVCSFNLKMIRKEGFTGILCCNN